ALGQVLPGAGDAEHVGLAAKPSLGADFARDARHFAGKGVELVHHRVERFLQLKDFARYVHGDLLGKVAAGDRGGDVGDVANLRREVRSHEVDVVGEVLPGAGHTGHLGLTTELAFGADLAGDAGHFGGKRVELVDHRVDGVGQILPGACDAGDDGLAAELAVGADFARDARHFGSKRSKLVHHRVDGFLELQDLAADVHRDLLRQVAIGHRDGDLGDVADLAGQVVGHRVDALGEVLPDAGHFRHLGLAAELAFGADLARHARHFRGEHGKLLDHRVDDVGRLQEFAAKWAAIDVELHGLQQIALGHGGDRARDLAGRPQQVVDQRVDRSLHVRPRSARQVELDALPRLALASDDLADVLQLLRHALVGGDDFVEGIGDLALDADVVAGHPYREIARAHRLQCMQQVLHGIGRSVGAGWFRLSDPANGG